ncbi:UNVERIFIED_ORG: putative PhzF superfamily epimerase YddE/YHI9 [Paraburkholderia sediminicola]|nr:putative PhzF superfamily epimerase YddE/YHI9 [Paraburkholderia sediminicola]
MADSTGRNDERGNTAIVVEDSALIELERLKFAQQRYASARVFVETNTASGMQLDYYYPHERIPLCLHATLAASTVFFERYLDSGRIQPVTGMHQQPLRAERVDHGIFIGVRSQRCTTLSIDVMETARLLRVKPSDALGCARSEPGTRTGRCKLPNEPPDAQSDPSQHAAGP